MWNQTGEPNVPHTVSEPASDCLLYCPDVVSVDHYLTVLGTYIGRDSNLSWARELTVRRDIDRLLDRRLTLTAGRAAIGST